MKLEKAIEVLYRNIKSYRKAEAPENIDKDSFLKGMEESLNILKKLYTSSTGGK